MADATVKTTVIVPAVAAVEAKEVTLRLNERETLALAAVCAKVGGDPRNSPRGDIEAIVNALKRIGFSYYNGEYGLATDPNYTLQFKLLGSKGSLWFSEYPATEGE